MDSRHERLDKLIAGNRIRTRCMLQFCNFTSAVAGGCGPTGRADAVVDQRGCDGECRGKRAFQET